MFESEDVDMSGYEYIPTPQEIAQEERDYAFRALVERFARVPMSSFTLEESLLMHKLYVAGAFTFPPKIDEKELALLKAAERRIFGKKGRKGNPYDAGKAGRPLYLRGRNHI